ncbi:MAG: hypothetical protein JWM46_418 [Candidatus Kaiserbacteria bacterium]|nr:hypothetical protein [Candidatus Kaiserbacteria bacterium]
MFWLLFAVFLVQDPITSSAVVLEAYRHGYSPLLIHAIFLAATLMDIAAGYGIGWLLMRRYAQSRLTLKARGYAERLLHSFGAHGHAVALILIAPAFFPLSAIFPPFLGISMARSIAYLLIGEIVFWYVFIWAIVFGLHIFGFDLRTSLYVLLAGGVCFVLVKRYVWRRVVKRRSEVEIE